MPAGKPAEGKKQANITFPVEVYEAIVRRAEEEDRPVANMILVMCKFYLREN